MNKRYLILLSLCIVPITIYLLVTTPQNNDNRDEKELPTARGFNNPPPKTKVTAKAKVEQNKPQDLGYKAQLNNTNYKIAKKKRAIRKSDFKGTPSEIIEEKSGYVIYEGSSENPLSFGEFDLPVLFNDDTGSIAILTGKIIVKTSFEEDINEIESTTKMYVEAKLQNINRYVLNAQNEKNIINSYKQLKSLNKFQEIELEIIDSSISPK